MSLREPLIVSKQLLSSFEWAPLQDVEIILVGFPETVIHFVSDITFVYEKKMHYSILINKAHACSKGNFQFIQHFLFWWIEMMGLNPFKRKGNRQIEKREEPNELVHLTHVCKQGKASAHYWPIIDILMPIFKSCS